MLNCCKYLPESYRDRVLTREYGTCVKYEQFGRVCCVLSWCIKVSVKYLRAKKTCHYIGITAIFRVTFLVGVFVLRSEWIPDDGTEDWYPDASGEPSASNGAARSATSTPTRTPNLSTPAPTTGPILEPERIQCWRRYVALVHSWLQLTIR